MFELISQHQFWTAVVVYWAFSAAVSSMPEPASNGSPGYLWLFRFLHTVAGNITTAFAGKIPGVKMLGLILVLLLVLPVSACGAHYKIHPGALNKTDSAAYDTLLIAEAAIDQARTDFTARRLPAQEKSELDTLIRTYNVARESWLTYRGAVATKVPSEIYFNQLTRNLTDLNNAIHKLAEAKQ